MTVLMRVLRHAAQHLHRRRARRRRARRRARARPSVVTPSPAAVWCEALSISICSRTAASRSTGSSMPTGRSANIADTRLSYVLAFVVRAHRDRDQRADDEPVGALAAAQEERAQPAGDGGDDDVVDRSAERAPDRLDVVERCARPRPAPVRSDAADEGVRPGRAGCDARTRALPRRRRAAARAPGRARRSPGRTARAASYGINAEARTARRRRGGGPTARARAATRPRPSAGCRARDRGSPRAGRCRRCRRPCSDGSS